MSCGMFPVAKNKKPTTAPGQYDYGNASLSWLSAYTVNFTGVEGPVWVIAHAVVCEVDGSGSDSDAMKLKLSCDGTEEVAQDKPKGKKSGDLKASSLKVYPNPFSQKVIFEFTAARNSHAVLEITNMLGQKVATVMDRQVEEGVLNRVEYEPFGVNPGTLIYRLRLDDHIQTGRLIYKQ